MLYFESLDTLDFEIEITCREITCQAQGKGQGKLEVNSWMSLLNVKKWPGGRLQFGLINHQQPTHQINVKSQKFSELYVGGREINFQKKFCCFPF